MKASNHFIRTILTYLELRAESDSLFAESFTKENKNIDDCITYILNEVQKSGCMGFAALSTELRAPLMQRIFFRSGFRQLYLSVNHAFGILPMVIGGLSTPRQFIANPTRSIAMSLRNVNRWHQHLLESLDEKECE